MRLFKREAASNFDAFYDNWQYTLDNVCRTLSGYKSKYSKSYFRLISLNSWRSNLLERKIDMDSLGFYFEAHNDAIVSHVLACEGAWRSALKSLRSAVENCLFCTYYKDHPIEFRLWNLGKHKLGFYEATKYMSNHPDIKKVPTAIDGLRILSKEYSMLSLAVHASAKNFRMSEDSGNILFIIADPIRLNKWLSRESQVLQGINLLLLNLYRMELQGTKLPNLRKAISLAIPKSKHIRIKESLGVHLYA